MRRLHVVEAGRLTAPLSSSSMAFPKPGSRGSTRFPALVAAGYRVLAPDMRGYNLSGKPKGVDAYRIEHLVADVAGLIRWAGAERAIVVGHDWGAQRRVALCDAPPRDARAGS